MTGQFEEKISLSFQMMFKISKVLNKIRIKHLKGANTFRIIEPNFEEQQLCF